MYCPVCGKELVLVEDYESREPNDESEWYACNTGCFHKDFPLVKHHPFDIRPGKPLHKQRPGDSWSLTWIK